MRRISIIFIFLLLYIVSSAQVTVYNKFWVQFSDKSGNSYSLNRPLDFLSQRSLDRRSRYHIAIDSTDLPITALYKQAIINTGVKVLVESKWLNAVTIETLDTALLSEVRALPFVVSVSPVAATTIFSYDGSDSALAIVRVTDDTEYYGATYNQVSMVHGEYLHNMGYRGEGMQIAVLDAGFRNADKISAFDSLRANHRILGTWDFVHGAENVYGAADHGRNVLSIIAGNLPGTFVGSAPNASYYLYITEDVNSEYKVEEDNWIAAAERADSLGVDMITTSLGYTQFDDPAMGYTYQDMTGHTARISQGANAAANKGILVVASAGNEGTNAWHYIAAPGDADSVMTVGAVDPSGNVARFSSRGPDFGGAIKPNIAGQGQSTAFIDAYGNVAVGSGTSYSAPLMAGFIACLWQSMPERNNMTIIHDVEQTASIANNPDNNIGYGIPDFEKALTQLIVDYKLGQGIYNVENYPLAFPNPFTNDLAVMLYAGVGGDHEVEVYDAKGSKVYYETHYIDANRFYRFDLSGLSVLQNGVYLVRVHNNNDNHVVRVVKL